MRYLARRLLLTLITFAGALTLTFLIVHLVPGDPARLILGDYFPEEAVAELRRTLGLDRPLVVQYGEYVGRVLRGDLGMSFRSQRAVWEEIAESFPFTLLLALGGVSCAVALGLPIGVISAVHRGRWWDRLSMVGALVGVSMPPFWLGLLLIFFLAFQLRLFPILGVGDPGDPLSLLSHLVLPSLTLGLRGAALIARVTRSSFLEVLGQDYVRTARAKGVPERGVRNRHALRNALIPTVTVIGLDLGRMLGGTTVVEIVFSRPGLGTLLVESVLARDYPMVQGALFVYLVIIVTVNLAVDLVYARVDPRIRYA